MEISEQNTQVRATSQDRVSCKQFQPFRRDVRRQRIEQLRVRWLQEVQKRRDLILARRWQIQLQALKTPFPVALASD